MAGMAAVAGSRPWNAFIQTKGSVDSRTTWHDVIGKLCPIFAVNREVLIPTGKPIGYTGTDPCKISEYTPRRSANSSGILNTGQNMFLKEKSEIDASSGFYVLFGSAFTFSFVLSIYVLQSSCEKLARFVRETVVESSSTSVGEFVKAD